MIYLAAPYTTGLPQGLSREAAMHARANEINRAAARMMAQGATVYSPISHGVSLEPHLMDELREDHDFWMRHCYGMLDQASEIAVLTLPGWDSSRGVQLEIAFAKERGIPISYQEPL